MSTLLQVEDLVVEFALERGILRAVNGVSLEIRQGEIFALVGESGSGKSTLAFALLGLVPPPGHIVGGRVLFRGTDVLQLNGEALREYRWRDVAMVFQAAQNVLNPVMRVVDHFLDTARDHGVTDAQEVLAWARQLLEMVRLEPDRVLQAYPHELSGGMRQRVAIALSLLLKPRLLILDEPTTALDVVTQAYILEILSDVRRELDLTMLLLTHDMSVVAKVADRVGVLYAGRVMEVGDVETIFYRPRHPYTVGLISAAPSLVGDLDRKRPIPGSPPDLINPPPGCPFAPRCAYATDRCATMPPLVAVGSGHWVACHHWEEVHREVTA